MSNALRKGVVVAAVGLLALSSTSALPEAVDTAPPAPEILLLHPDTGATGLVRIAAVTNSTEVDYVAFFLDGFLVAAVHSPPHEALIDLGTGGKEQKLRAVAFDRSARQLAESSFTFGRKAGAARLAIVELDASPGGSPLSVGVEVAPPPGRKVERVDFYWNDGLLASRPTPPYRATLDVPSRVRGDHVRVVALLDDGERLETARLADRNAAGDRVDVNLVQLYAVVTDRLNRPRSDLAPADFTVSQAGRSREIERFAMADDVPLTLGLAIDTSESMRPWMHEAHEAGAMFFETTLGERDRAFLVEFADRPRLTQALTGDPELLRERLGEIEVGRHTAFYDAILYSLAQFDGVGGRKALVVLTDGEDYGSHFRPERCIEQALAQGVQIYLIELSDPMRSADRPLGMLNRRIAKETGGRLYAYRSHRGLEEIYAEIRSELQSQYLLAWSSEQRLSDRELRDVTIEVRDRRLSVRAVPAHRVQRP